MTTFEEFEQKIRGLSGPKDYGQLLHEVARQTRDETRERFLREEDPDGNAWPALAESTKERKRRKGYPAETKLVESGRLWASLGGIEEIGTDSLTWGSDDPKAAFHDGDERPSTRVPQRQIVGFSEGNMDRIAEQTADFVEKDIARAFDGLA